MHETEKEEYVHGVFETIASGYDSANRRISLGLQDSWKKMLTDRLVGYIPFRTRFLDLCCGTGDIAVSVARQRPDVKVTGADFSRSMLCVARRKGRGLENVRWRQADAMHLPYPDETFDAVSISFGLRNTPDYRQVVSEMRRVVKKGGYIYCLDSFVPDCRLVIPFYRLYFRYIMPVIGGGKKYKSQYRWLWKSTQMFLRRGQLEELFRNVGLKNIASRSRMFGACSLVWGRK